MRTQGLAAALLAGVCCLAGTARAQKIEIAWDPGLAFQADRKNYQKMLTGIVSRGAATVSARLGIRLQGPLRLKVYTPANYKKAFGPRRAARSGAHYLRGTIHVNGGSRLNDRFAGLLEHELAHALLDFQGTARLLPLWLNEGIAEGFRWRRVHLEGLAPNQIQELKRNAEADALKLQARGQLTPNGYLQSYAAVLFIEKQYGLDKLASLVHKTLESKDFEKSLRQIVNLRPGQLKRQFAEWVTDLE